MTSMVAWLPAFFSFYFVFFRSPQRALLSVYLPVLILLPQIFLAETVGFPPLTFHETAAIPIVMAILILDLPNWKFSLADFLIIGFISCAFIAEFVNENLHFAINKLASLLCDIFAPYVIGKALIYPMGINIAFSRRFVFLMFINVILCLYELRMTSVPQITLTNWFFPSQNAFDWPPLFRFGFVRINGPFIQTIFFATGLFVVIFLNYWLIKNKFWTSYFKYLPTLPLRKGTIIAIVLLFGLLFTFSRGPWLSFFLGFLIIGSAYSRNPRASFLLRTLSVVLLTFFIFQSLFNVDQFMPFGENQDTVYYRANLFEDYGKYITEKPIWGWGLANLPLLWGSHSIDNAYLLIQLQYGAIALGFYLFLIFWMLFRLGRRFLSSFRNAPLYSSLTVTLFVITISMAISFITVYMGLQVLPLFFLIIGWSEGLLCSKADDALLLKEQAHLFPSRKGAPIAHK